MSMFAKIFNNPLLGQLLVTKDVEVADDNTVSPSLTLRFLSNGIMVEHKTVFEASPVGQLKRNIIFHNLDEMSVFDCAVKVLEQTAEAIHA